MFFSRLARREEKRNLKKAFLFGFLTIGLVLLLVFFGIPSLIRIAVFLADIKNTNAPIEQTDTLPPTVPRFNSLPEYVKDASFNLSGLVEPGSTVEIFLNGSATGAIVSTAEGTFNFSNLVLNQEKNEIYAIATDEAGNKSQSSSKITVFWDNIPPKLEVLEPQEGTNFSGEKKRKIKISGQTEENVSLTINERLIILDSGGNFSADFILSDGENIIKVVASDQAGNQTEKEIKIIFSP